MKKNLDRHIQKYLDGDSYEFDCIYEETKKYNRYKKERGDAKRKKRREYKKEKHKQQKNLPNDIEQMKQEANKNISKLKRIHIKDKVWNKGQFYVRDFKLFSECGLTTKQLTHIKLKPKFQLPKIKKEFSLFKI